MVEEDISKRAINGDGATEAINAFEKKYPNGEIVDTVIGKVKVNKRSIKDSGCCLSGTPQHLLSCHYFTCGGIVTRFPEDFME